MEDAGVDFGDEPFGEGAEVLFKCEPVDGGDVVCDRELTSDLDPILDSLRTDLAALAGTAPRV